MVKQDQIDSMQGQLDLFKNVDLDKYRNLTSDLRIAQNTIKENEKHYNEIKDQSEERHQICRRKDRQIANLKRLMQHAIFHMLIDVQEMVDRTQMAKDEIYTEVSGFDEENYMALQGVRLSYAQKGLQSIRRV